MINKIILKFSIKLVLLMLTFILFYSCIEDFKSKDDLLKSDIWKVAEELQSMKVTDQQIRNGGKFMNYYYGSLDQERLFDEFKWKEYDFSKMHDSLGDFLKKPVFKNQVIIDEYKREQWQQSLAVQYIDSLNLQRLIELTEYYGFPGHNRLKKHLPDTASTDLTSSPMLIFVHTRESMKDSVAELIIKEYKAGRIETNPCSHIFWHLNGREVWPINFDYCERFK